MKAFYEKYLTLNLKDYGLSVDLEINKILIIIFLGLCAACFFVNYSQSNIALALRKLLRSGAVGESNAKTLSELGLSNAKPIKKLLSKSAGPMKSIVSYVGEIRLTYEEYIEKEKAERAAKKARSKGDVKRASRDIQRVKTSPDLEINAEENEACLTSDTEELTIADPSNTPIADTADNSQGVKRNKSKSKAKNDFDTVDFSSAKFFIREDKKDAAMRAFTKNSGSLIKTILSCVLLLGFCAGLIFLMPTLLMLVKGIVFKQ